MKKRLSRWSIVLLLGGGMILGMGINRLISADSIYDQLNKLKDVLILSEKYYVDEVDTKKLTEAAINGMISRLDPHSVYIPPSAFERVTEEFRGKYQGVGLYIGSLNDTIIVVEPMGGGPSARLGILSNDKIVRIDDSLAVGLTTGQASQRLRGPKGTKVQVTIVRAGFKDPLIFEVTRDEISINSVDVALITSNAVGYVSVTKFAEPTHIELAKVLESLKDQGMKRLILDLRQNPGGILDEAVRMADMFLDGGPKDNPRKIVYTKARRPEMEETHVATSGQPFEKLPIIVLVNNASASASEIVAGAIQDWDRGLVVGETTFGKGLVQRQFTLSDGSALRLTIARYYTPSGRLIQRSYEGKAREEYQREAFEREEQEGENVLHKNDLHSQADSLRQMFKTAGGRVVYGGGGITPDYVVKPTSISKFTENSLRRDLFYQYISGYLDGAGSGLRTKYKDFGSFSKTYVVSDEMLAQFRGFVEKKGVTGTDEEFKQDRSYIQARMKAYVARSIWGNEGWYSVLLVVDQQFQKALTLFPEAIRIARLN